MTPAGDSSAVVRKPDTTPTGERSKPAPGSARPPATT